MRPDEETGGRAQYCTFKVGELMIGIDARRVQEVIKQEQLTPVPLAPAEVCGLINLRGQIVTAVNLASLLGVRQDNAFHTNVVVHAGAETVSLLVEAVGDVVSTTPDQYRKLPAGVPARVANLMSGTFKLKGSDRLLLLLDLDQVAARLDAADTASPQRRSA
jgi:purine-binding chemotaxis protein CheW